MGSLEANLRSRICANDLFGEIERSRRNRSVKSKQRYNFWQSSRLSWIVQESLRERIKAQNLSQLEARELAFISHSLAKSYPN